MASTTCPVHWQTVSGHLACDRPQQKYGATVWVGDIPVKVTHCCARSLTLVTCDDCKRVAAEAGIVGTKAEVTP